MQQVSFPFTRSEHPMTRSTAAVADLAAGPSSAALSAEPTSAPVKPRGSRSRARNRTEVVVPLGSLTQPGSRPTSVCRTCASPRVTSLTLTLTDGTPVEFTSCHACESKSWLTAEGELDRASVLERTRKIR